MLLFPFSFMLSYLGILFLNVKSWWNVSILIWLFLFFKRKKLVVFVHLHVISFGFVLVLLKVFPFFLMFHWLLAISYFLSSIKCLLNVTLNVLFHIAFSKDDMRIVRFFFFFYFLSLFFCFPLCCFACVQRRSLIFSILWIFYTYHIWLVKYV